MDRLTTYLPDGTATIERNINGLKAQSNHLLPSDIETVKRLAAYEDTGLDPEEITDLMVSKAAAETIVRQYEEWEKDGTIIRLPFKAWDTVWSAKPFKDGKPRIGSIVQINFDVTGFCGFWVDFSPEPVAAEFFPEDIGNTVFSTREEAEAALGGGVS